MSSRSREGGNNVNQSSSPSSRAVIRNSSSSFAERPHVHHHYARSSSAEPFRNNNNNNAVGVGAASARGMAATSNRLERQRLTMDGGENNPDDSNGMMLRASQGAALRRRQQPPPSSPPQQQPQQPTTARNEGWTAVPTDGARTGRPPCQRSLHAAAVLRDSMYVFGGYDGLNRVNDFYEFDFNSGTWREIVTLNANPNVVPRQPPGGGGATVTATGSPPSPRDRHAAVVHGGSFYVFGGFDGTSRVSDLHGFDVDRMAWREVRPRAGGGGVDVDQVANLALGENGNGDPIAIHGAFGGRDGGGPAMPNQNPQRPHQQQFHPPPSPRHSHAAVVHEDSLYVFGGYDGSYRSDFHEFSFATRGWRPVAAAGRAPRARYRSTACVRGNAMILFGGHDGTRHLADVHTFDFGSGAWSSLVVGGVPPLPRDSHVSVVYRDSMYVFGGSTGSAMNDLYELNFHSTGTGMQILENSANEGGRDIVSHGSGNAAEDGHGPEVGAGVAVHAAPQPDTTIPSPSSSGANWRQIPLVSGGVAVHRFCHVGAIYKGSLYVFGGYDGSSRLNDFVKYDLAADNLFETDIPPSSLLSDLRSFLDDEDVLSLADITLMVEGIPVRAHKLMLMRCPYFRAMLLGDMAESTQTVINLEIVRRPIFMLVLEYLYTDSVAVSLDSAMELFVAADCFDLPRLQAMCERRLLESMAVDNAATIFHAADVYSAASLREKALGYVLSHFEAVSKTMAFEEMARSNVELVFEILKSR